MHVWGQGDRGHARPENVDIILERGEGSTQMTALEFRANSAEWSLRKYTADLQELKYTMSVSSSQFC